MLGNAFSLSQIAEPRFCLLYRIHQNFHDATGIGLPWLLGCTKNFLWLLLLLGPLCKRLLRRLAKKLIVIVVCEFRTSCLCHFCGSGVQHPKAGKSRGDIRGTVHCNDSHCVSRGLFKNRDTAAACNIGCRFVYDFFLGGYLGGFSECELLTNGQPRPEMRIGFFQIFRPL